MMMLNAQALQAGLEQVEIQAHSLLPELKAVGSSEQIRALRAQYLGKNSPLISLLKHLRGLDEETKRQFIPKVQALRSQFESQFRKAETILEDHMLLKELAEPPLEVRLPGDPAKAGSAHPINQTIEFISSYFESAGFKHAVGPEIEERAYNFDLLNFPDWHPALADKDTFWLNPKRLLRTHTSGVQIRSMRCLKPPIRILSPGRVYRPDSDATHTPMFHQIEGLMVDVGLSFAHLKGVLQGFLKYFFSGLPVRIRFRPSYFPFTVPSAEVDVQLHESGPWLETLGCGMVHPNVLESGGLDPTHYSGFAFGMGVERFAMLRHQTPDLRNFFENDVRFLGQFSSVL